MTATRCAMGVTPAWFPEARAALFATGAFAFCPCCAREQAAAASASNRTGRTFTYSGIHGS